MHRIRNYNALATSPVRRDALDIIDRETGLRGLILRPLTAKLLKPTIPEINGIVNRDLLYGFGGRTRKPQMALAAEFGLTEYPSPAGGCLLTEPNYSDRLSELLSHDPDPSFDDLNLLRVGRHFRLSPACRVIVARDESENNGPPPETTSSLSSNAPPKGNGCSVGRRPRLRRALTNNEVLKYHNP